MLVLIVGMSEHTVNTGTFLLNPPYAPTVYSTYTFRTFDYNDGLSIARETRTEIGIEGKK